MKITLPCKECLVYAVCKHKNNIKCSILMNKINKEYSGYRMFELVTKVLPKWKKLTDGKICYHRNTTNQLIDYESKYD